MDDELRQAFATMSAQMSVIASDVSHGTSLQKETISEVKYLAGSVDQLSGRVQRLEHHVFGSNPPPPPTVAPVMKRITQGEGDIADLTGRVMAMQAANAEQSTKLIAIEDAMTANNAATFAIKREVVDGVKSFWKRNPKLETALVAVLLALAGLGYTALTHGGQLP